LNMQLDGWKVVGKWIKTKRQYYESPIFVYNKEHDTFVLEMNVSCKMNSGNSLKKVSSSQNV
jgi:hypothetical protein